ncbi:MAG: hypothetical protein U9Q68_06510 [Euryarchaeota archaeon]|nr:hypothetical protein [Euryarchaeota archaeon]
MPRYALCGLIIFAFQGFKACVDRMWNKNRGECYGTIARKIDVSKEFRDFRGFRDYGYIVFDQEDIDQEGIDELHQKSTPKRER